MKEAIIKLSSDTGLRKEMGDNGKKAIISEYNISIQGKALSDLYSGLIPENEIKD